MSFIELDVVSPLVEYHLVLKRRITLLIGDSGSGKTVLDNLVQDSSSNPTINIKCVKNVYIVPAVDSYKDAFSKKDCVILIDENNLNIKNAILLSRNLVVNDNYLIIATRDFLDFNDKDISKHFDLSLDSLCKLTTVGSVHYNEPMYNFNRIKDLSKYDKVLVEDRAAGFQFFQLLHSNVVSTEGKDNALKYDRDLKGNTLLVIDLAVFGKYANEFYKKFYIRNKDVAILPDYECFEELLLHTNVFKDNEDVKMLFSDLSVCNTELTWERYFENFLLSVKGGTVLEPYKHGGKLPYCFYANCGTSVDCNNFRREKCDKTLKSETKLFDILSGTKYEHLLPIKSLDVTNIPDDFKSWCDKFIPEVYSDYPLEDKWKMFKDMYIKM